MGWLEKNFKIIAAIVFVLLALLLVLTISSTPVVADQSDDALPMDWLAVDSHAEWPGYPIESERLSASPDADDVTTEYAMDTELTLPSGGAASLTAAIGWRSPQQI
ncbi:hypothetical protein [Marinobacter sp. BGYM27]|uniref:hypothetical protein n=1 Tax=Marinobacter sp. BGYM27 TaxID=2975597 RepID=UPI0021A681F8|nr:hypothetical protein [Marinobacter sp. BGYM27]MDG5498937.1 hypothetical protein [Marinobacter sp. BGYM27]